jgi:hypothetical protein
MDARKRISLRLATDEDGYMSQECPCCENRFKVKYGEGSDKPISFCPYCKHKGQNCWWTKEQVDYLESVVVKESIVPEFEKMTKEINRNSHKGGLVTLSMDIKPSPKPIFPQETKCNWPIVFFECCCEKIKHERSQEVLFCPICGKEKECA